MSAITEKLSNRNRTQRRKGETHGEGGCKDNDVHPFPVQVESTGYVCRRQIKGRMYTVEENRVPGRPNDPFGGSSNITRP